MIKADNLFKSYQQLQVLKGVSIQINASEIVSIVGSSGAGKSTLLHLLGTLDTADSGTIFIDDLNITQMKPKAINEFRNKSIGFIFQFHHLLPEFTALENVCMPAWIGKQNKTKTTARAKELLGYLGVADRMEHKPSQLSGGEQQRVAVARALINNPSVVFADEPSGNLDSENANQLHKLFVQLRNDFKQTFVIVTHNEQLANLADRKFEMKDGTLS